jgi:pimeloyl-ACP methyl ester carboxylesterase
LQNEYKRLDWNGWRFFDLTGLLLQYISFVVIAKPSVFYHKCHRGKHGLPGFFYDRLLALCGAGRHLDDSVGDWIDQSLSGKTLLATAVLVYCRYAAVRGPIIMNVYFISGLGADRQAFEKIKLPARFVIHYLDWIKNKKGETLNEYARRLAAAIDTTQPFALVGLSMGGMIASAMTQFLHPYKTVLISSVGCREEFPPLFKLARLTQIHRLIPTFLFHQPNPIAHFLFGAKSKNEKRIIDHIIAHSDARFVKWSISAILSWNNKIRHKALYHIHGDKDKILPVKYTKPDVVVKNGSHFMVWTKAGEVSRLLLEALESPSFEYRTEEQGM